MLTLLLACTAGAETNCKPAMLIVLVGFCTTAFVFSHLIVDHPVSEELEKKRKKIDFTHLKMLNLSKS